MPPARMPASLLLLVGVLAWPGAAARAQDFTAPVAVPGRPVTVQAPQVAAAMPVRYQPATPGVGEASQPSYQIQLEPPGLGKLATVLQTDASLQERIRQETLSNPSTATERVEFPDEPILSRDRYAGRGNLWQQRGIVAEPNFVNYRKLLFQDVNAERYGWDLGFIQPFVSYGLFLKDVALLPMHLFNDPCRKNESSTGYCLPGDPVPYLCYPPGITLSGAVAEVATVFALLAIFP